jgi:hypothetical protein
MKTYWGAYSFLTSALAESEWSTSRLGCFNLGEIVPFVSTEYEAGGAPQPAWTSFGFIAMQWSFNFKYYITYIQSFGVHAS